MHRSWFFDYVNLNDEALNSFWEVKSSNIRDHFLEKKNI